jgi:4-hydroxybenzoyl-CoA thioesterase
MMAPLPAEPPAHEFATERLVRFADCDPAGIVFFPNYFLMLNGVVEDWWSHIGHPWTVSIGQRRIGTPVAHLDSIFVAPSLLGETLCFYLSVDSIGRSSLTLHHRVVGPNGRERVRIRQRLVATSLDSHRSIPWPDDMRRAIAKFKERT